MTGASIAPPLRPAMARIVLSERLPVDGLSSTILSPDQNDPKLSHQRPDWSTTRFGSMALKLSEVRDSMTRPWLVQVPEAPVVLVARKIADRLEPNVDAE
jgi:hypothetical protein